jgi:Glycosyltransferase like family 2
MCHRAHDHRRGAHCGALSVIADRWARPVMRPRPADVRRRWCSIAHMGSQGSSGVLRVQTVLFEQAPKQLWRLLRGLNAAARLLLDADLVTRVEWALGDCGPTPVLKEDDTRSMREASSSALSDITYEFFGANLGSSGGQNRLAMAHPCDELLILNPDTYPSPTALVELVRRSRDPDVGIVEPRQIPLEHPRAYDVVTGETSWASGFCMLIRRGIFDAVGGFDDTHFLLHCDDVDLSWRVRAAGYKVVVAPYAAVFHDKRPRQGNAWPAPDVELYHAALGRLMLASRWGRPDIVADTVASIESGASDVQREALAEFRARRASGSIPDVEPSAAAVAEFVNGEYAVHRF